MRIVEFVDSAGLAAVGVVVEDRVHPVPPLRARDHTVFALLQNEQWLEHVAQVREDPAPGHAPVALADLRYRPLLANEGRVIAIGLNFEKKYPAGEQRPTPEKPPWFAKLPGAFVAHGEQVVNPRASVSFDYEVELAAIIGVGGRHIAVDNALAHVAGWTCVNDGSVREWQRHSLSAGKNFHNSSSIGPWMVTADEIDDPQDLLLTARVDGEVRQHASTKSMLFTVAEIIAYLSTAIELKPGDVITTGSPEGTGGSFDPPRFLVAGQQVEVEIEGIGVLANTVVDEPPA